MSKAKTTKSAEKHAKPAKDKTRAKKSPGDAAPLDTNALNDAPLLETPAAPLGTLLASVETSGSENLTSVPAPKHEVLRLPKGAFLAFRKSGGLHFSSRAVVIYPDGRVAFDARGVPQKEYNRLRRAFNDGQMLSLRKLLDQTNFWKTESAGQQNPDAFAYEIAARIGQRANEVEVFDGSVPENLTPLLERLTPLLNE
jgi:hypothetical protein